jgi:hypothetical protein
MLANLVISIVIKCWRPHPYGCGTNDSKWKHQNVTHAGAAFGSADSMAEWCWRDFEATNDGDMLSPKAGALFAQESAFEIVSNPEVETVGWKWKP